MLGRKKLIAMCNRVKLPSAAYLKTAMTMCLNKLLFLLLHVFWDKNDFFFGKLGY
jgi:hypothetical protein